MTKYKKIDLANIKTYSIKNRKSKVSLNDFAKPIIKNQSIDDFIESLPTILSGQSFKEFLNDYANTIKSKSENRLPLNPGGSYFPNESFTDEPINIILIIFSLGSNFDFSFSMA